MVIYNLIFNHLKKCGFKVFAPNAHKGECVEDYLVVKQGVTTQYNNYSTQIVLYDILCYAKNYSDCIKLKSSVREKMKELEFDVMPTDNEEEAYFDDSVKGYMSSIEYRNYKKRDYQINNI